MTKIKLLIVEDEAMFAMVLKNNLQLCGYQVCEPVSTGQAAVQAVIDEQPEAVLMDIRLVGEMDGIAAAEQILSSCAVPIIFMTGYSDEKTETRARALAPAAYLVKPITPLEIEPVLNTLFQ